MRAAVMTGDRGLCVYAITRGREWDRVTFPEMHAGQSPALISQNGLGLVAAEVDLALFGGVNAESAEDGLLARLAREHDAVVRAVFDHEPVLPLRFGTIVTDTAAARRLLDSGHAQVSEWLDRVANHREWGVRVEHEDTDQRSNVPLTGISGADYLRMGRQSQMSWQKRASTVQSLHIELARHATSAANRARPRALLDATYLVPQANEDEFRAAAARLHEEVQRLGATVHATGPWPPYSFTRIELAVH
ncbi:hypothetical protein JOF56_003091 [Kibdelosporangium banguiense]|uniref:Gas vesicle synthesis protein GvpL/GvpF n=1 Tax=Kibdelosporangium banguiense TaxID=1365924 RepID=A0ABS4TFU6_9PSEU|nr:GvpL/GvpF family gas vesicle protein [Kibdelosporangium banguiense]MBP2322706.1 hypothetical protein [Kibdelosporangium banguiense]